jgi:hypothetical protein
MQELKKEIENILDTELKGFYYSIEIDNGWSLDLRKNTEYINIDISYFHNFKKENNYISLSLREDTLLLIGRGGCVWRKSDPANKSECYEISHEKIPFRTPKKEKTAVLKAIKNICQKYKSILKDIASRGLLLSEDLPATIELINSHQKTP